MKTEKEKARELVERFREAQQPCPVDEHVIQCALICVDEIIESNPMIEDFDETPKGRQVWHVSNLDYWQQVRKKIESYE